MNKALLINAKAPFKINISDHPPSPSVNLYALCFVSKKDNPPPPPLGVM